MAHAQYDSHTKDTGMFRAESGQRVKEPEVRVTGRNERRGDYNQGVLYRRINKKKKDKEIIVVTS